MGKKKVTLSIDTKVYSDFKKHCEKNAIMLSKKIELIMRDLMKLSKTKKFLLIFFVGIFLMNFISADVIFQDDFESGSVAGWNLTAQGTANNWAVSSGDPFQGTWHAQSNPRDVGSWSRMERNFSTLGYENINFTYYRKLVGLDAADDFLVDWFNGTDFIALESLGSGTANDGTYLIRSFNLSSAKNISDFKIRFSCEAGAVSEHCRIDNVNVTGDLIIDDTFPPEITINSPLNATFGTPTPRLNLTISESESDVDTVWISLNGGETNITYAHSNGTIDFGYLDLIFADDFDSYPNNSNGTPIWDVKPWFQTVSTDNKTFRLYNETPIIDALASINGFSELDYWVSSSVMVPSGFNGSAYLTPRFGNVNDKYEIALDYDFSSININKVVNGTWSSLVALWTGDLPSPIFISKDEWHLLGSRVKGNNISAYVDGQFALSVIDTDLNNATFSGFSLIALDDIDTHTAYFDDLEFHRELKYGSHTLTVYANDTLGNENSTSVSFFVGSDSYVPEFYNFSAGPSNGSAYSEAGFYEFNVTLIEETLDTIGIEFNGVNYTNEIYFRGNNIYSFNRSDLGAGTYNYYWWANDSGNNFNLSSVQSFTIEKANSEVNTYLNHSRNNISVFSGSSVYLNGSLITGVGNIQLYLNESLINSGTSPLSNLTTFNDVGLFNVTVIYAGNANYSGSSEAWFANVTQAPNSPPVVYHNFTIVNNTIKTPEFGESFFVQVNVSDPESDAIIYTNFTLAAPNGSLIINNVKGSEFFVDSYSLWNSTKYEINDYGIWNWSYELSDGNNVVSEKGSFRVYGDLFIFPSSYLESPDPFNKTLIWNLSLYHLSWENYTLNFSYSLNTTYFNLTFKHNGTIIDNLVYNSSNLFDNEITIMTDVATPIGAYPGHINITRQEDGKVFQVPIELGIDPPTGNIDAFSLTGSKCSAGNCDVDTTMENDESSSFSWRLNNTGNFMVSECKPSITGFNISNFGGFSADNFSLNISEAMTLTLNINQPSINSYYGELEVICAATSLGFNNSLGAERDNVPSLDLIVIADTGSSSDSSDTGSSGGNTGIVVVSDIKTELGLGSLPSLVLDAGEEREILWNVKNIGTKFLNGCSVSGVGEYFDWIKYSGGLKNLASGEIYDFAFDLEVPEEIEEGQYVINVSLSCQEINESSVFIVEVLEKQINFELINAERIGSDKIRIIYSLEELSGLDQNLELQFLLFDSRNEKIAEIEETRFLSLNSEQEFETFIDIDENLEGVLILLININSETYSTFIEESIILGPSVTGLTIFGEEGLGDYLVSGILALLFLVFAFFILKRIFGHKKHLKIRKKVKVVKKSNKGKVVIVRKKKRLLRKNK